MSSHRFIIGQCFVWESELYEIKRIFPEEKQANIENVFTKAIRLVPLAELHQALFDGTLKFEVRGKQARRTPDSHVSTANEYLELADYPELLVAQARERLKVIQPLLDLPPTQRTRAAFMARVDEAKAAGDLTIKVSVRSVYRWIQEYTYSGNDLRALIAHSFKRGGRDASRLDETVTKIIEAVINEQYYQREKVTADDIRDEVAVRIEETNLLLPPAEKLQVPALATINRRLSKPLDREQHALKHGKRAAELGYTQYGRTGYPTVPLERVEIDHTRMDLIVIDDEDGLPLGRMTLTYCLDMATRYPLGLYMGFEPPSYYSVMECLYHAICPKPNLVEKYGTDHEWLAYGLPDTLVTDNGKEFIGKDLEDSCQLLGIVLQRTPVKHPEFKGGVERALRSAATMLLHKIPGTTFSNIRERGDYDSISQACLYLSKVDEVICNYIVDIYAEKYHRGLKGIPRVRWEALTHNGFAPRLPPNAEELRILLGRTDMRTVQHYGVEFKTLRYNSPALVTLRTRLQGELTKIKYHPGDMSRIYVYDPFENLYIETPALDQEYTQGLSLWKHAVIHNAVLESAKEVNPVNLGLAKRRIQAIVNEGRARKRVGTRTKSARWDTAGKPASELTEPTPPPESPPAPPQPPLPPAYFFELDEQADLSDYKATFNLPKSRSD